MTGYKVKQGLPFKFSVFTISLIIITISIVTIITLYRFRETIYRTQDEIRGNVLKFTELFESSTIEQIYNIYLSFDKDEIKQKLIHTLISRLNHTTSMLKIFSLRLISLNGIVIFSYKIKSDPIIHKVDIVADPWLKEKIEKNEPAGRRINGNVMAMQIIKPYHKDGISYGAVLWELSLKSARTQIFDIIFFISIIAGSIVVISSILAFLFVSLITTPLKLLTNAIKNIELDIYKESIQINSNDEIGEMAVAFNNMRKRLQNVRAIISDNLHQTIAHDLIEMNMKLNDEELPLDKQKWELEKLIKKTLMSIRKFMFELNPINVEKGEFIYTLKDYFDTINNQKLKIIFTTNFNTIDKYRDDQMIVLYNILTNEELIHLIYIIIEAINNIIKHAQADQAKICFEYKNGKLYLSIEDNGKGFDIQLIKLGIHQGIKSIKKRVSNMQARCHIVSELDKGSKILIIKDIKKPTRRKLC